MTFILNWVNLKGRLRYGGVGNLSKEAKISLFRLEGQFVEFVSEPGKLPKYIRVATSTEQHCIKLSKYIRGSVYAALQPGDWVQLFGEQKHKVKTGEQKLKAYQVTVTVPTQHKSIVEAPVAPAPKTKACVMVCQKSSCRKRGADQVCQALTQSLRDRHLDDQVAIKGTGCMKQCKQGPCVVVMPDKTRYTEVSPQQIPTLIEKHFAAKLKPEVKEPEFSPVR